MVRHTVVVHQAATDQKVSECHDFSSGMSDPWAFHEAEVRPQILVLLGLRYPFFLLLAESISSTRLFKFPQMDFEMAIWEMTSLLIAPKKVFRSMYYHVGTLHLEHV